MTREPLDEERPAGIDPRLWEAPERETDLYALWESMTALTQEVRLQGRAFKQLRDSLEKPAGGDSVPLLLEMRERLARHGAAAREAARDEGTLPWWHRLLPGAAAEQRRRREVLESVAEGALLCLGRLDEALGRLGVVELPALGRPFDPQTMEVTEAVYTSEVPEGMVLEVLQAGYLQGGELLRPARVRVSRRGPEQESQS